MPHDRNARELDADKNARIGIIGITGGIGSGKTVATDALESAGYYIIDADEISRALFGKNTAGEREIAALFPEYTVDGKLDRTALRNGIANDGKKRTRLNDFTHPRIISEITRALAAAPKPVVLSAPLLFETALARLCDRTVCIYCPTELKIERIMQRDGVSREYAQSIISAQIPDTERCTLADYIVPSDVDKTEFKKEILDLFKKIVANRIQ